MMVMMIFVFSFKKSTFILLPMREIINAATLNKKNASKRTSDHLIAIATARLADEKGRKRCILLQHQTHKIGGQRFAGCQPRAACKTCLETICDLYPNDRR